MIKTFFLNLSLNKKLILMMLVMTAVLLVTLITIYWQSEKNLLAQLESQTAELAQAVQVGVEEVTGGASSETRLEKYLSSLKTKGIKEISIISNADEIIASTNPTKVGTPVSQRKKELIIKAELGEPAVDQEGKAYNVIIPVIAGQAHYGYIHLQINVENLQETMRRNTTKRIIAALSVFAIGILLSTFLSMWYTDPIHNVVAAARRVAAGDLNQNLPVDRKDEIGDLTRSFNFMVQRLREQRRLEERLREAEHLSAMGQLSRGIAHEIRNPLNFISLSIDHIRTKYRPADGSGLEGFEKLVESMKQEIHRLDRLVRDFLDYGKPLKLDRQPCRTQELLADVLDGERGEAVGQQHGQVVEQRPVAFPGDAEHPESQQEEIAEQAGEIRFAGGQQDGGGVAAQNAEDGDANTPTERRHSEELLAASDYPLAKRGVNYEGGVGLKDRGQAVWTPTGVEDRFVGPVDGLSLVAKQQQAEPVLHVVRLIEGDGVRAT